jgi:hypothetical protein
MDVAFCPVVFASKKAVLTDVCIPGKEHLLSFLLVSITRSIGGSRGLPVLVSFDGTAKQKKTFILLVFLDVFCPPGHPSFP